MNQEVKKVIVELKKNDNSDILAFYLEEEYCINLNSESCQNDLKKVFSALLEQLIVTSIELDLIIAQDYKSVLFIDVCTEYIKELNREIKLVIKKIPQKEYIQIKDYDIEEVDDKDMIS